ncbi:hypothetical protein DPMN_090989 [Dreissena polymorpha]|uniref:Uncharacterized protein n=1 Tax=Dreissena polymorpha TaxID=45954 RepID=A0A9D4R0A1_DREPO|nr:hypothetical protein DPMN_090989 [Dreissena polymorpha]
MIPYSSEPQPQRSRRAPDRTAGPVTPFRIHPIIGQNHLHPHHPIIGLNDLHPTHPIIGPNYRHPHLSDHRPHRPPLAQSYPRPQLFTPAPIRSAAPIMTPFRTHPIIGSNDLHPHPSFHRLQ